MGRLLTCSRGHQWESSGGAENQQAPRPMACPRCGEETFLTGAEVSPASARETPEDLPPRPAPVAQDLMVNVFSVLAPAQSSPSIAGYEILAELGRGGMGVVYKARQVSLDRVVALKMILAGAHAGPDELARFRREAEAVARLHHPHIIQIHEVGSQDGQPFLSLEFMEGGSLAQKLAGTPLPARAAAELLETLARAVHAAHRQGVIHRDLKPANVLLTSDGVPKITDFGLAKRLDVTLRQTQSGVILGTPGYMAPEQATGRISAVGPASDVYACGAILYELLTGRPPFKAETPLDTILQAIAEDPVPPSHLQPKVPKDLETICLKCLAREPRQRYGSAEELADDLRRFLQNRPIVARPASALYRLRKLAGRHRALVAGVAVAFLALVGGIITTSIFLARATVEKARAVRAEQDLRRLLAQSHVHNARQAMQRGSWRIALVNLDKALETGSANEVAVRLDKVRAWCAVHEVPQAVREIQALSRRTDLGDLEGTVLLWQGDLALCRAFTDRHALRLIRRALTKKLSSAEAAYARGLLAETSSQALRCFQKVVELDPSHQRAQGMLALLLLLFGRLQEARDQVIVAELLFPEDPTFKILHALVHGVQGDLPASLALLDKTRTQLADEEVEAARAFVQGLFLKAAVQSSGQKRTIGRCRAPRSDWRNVLLRHGIAAPNFRRRSAETVHRLPRPLRKCPSKSPTC